MINAVDYLKQINDQRLQKHAELEEKVKQLRHGRNPKKTDESMKKMRS